MMLDRHIGKGTYIQREVFPPTDERFTCKQMLRLACNKVLRATITATQHSERNMFQVILSSLAPLPAFLSKRGLDTG